MNYATHSQGTPTGFANVQLQLTYARLTFPFVVCMRMEIIITFKCLCFYFYLLLCHLYIGTRDQTHLLTYKY